MFVTLAYLAIQVRHARDEVRRSLSRERFEASRDLSIAEANNAMGLALRTEFRADIHLDSGEISQGKSRHDA